MDMKEIAKFALDGLQEYANRIFEFAVNDPENREALIEEYNGLAKKAEYLKSLMA